MKLILTKLVNQHMPLYATETLIVQKQYLSFLIIFWDLIMIIVQIQAPKMNAKPRESTNTISVKKVPHVFARVRISLLFSNDQNVSLQLVKSVTGQVGIIIPKRKRFQNSSNKA